MNEQDTQTVERFSPYAHRGRYGPVGRMQRDDNGDYVKLSAISAMTAERDTLAAAGRAAYLRLLELARQDMLNKSETEDMEKLGAALRSISGRKAA